MKSCFKWHRYFGLAVVIAFFSLSSQGYSEELRYLNVWNAVSLNIDQSAVTISLSYPGELSGQCGIKFVDFGDNIPTDFADQVTVTATSLSPEVTIQSKGPTNFPELPVYDVSPLVLQDQFFAIWLEVRTKNGSNLSSLGRSLVAVSTPCAM